MQLVEHLPHIHEAPGASPRTTENQTWWHVPKCPVLRRLGTGGSKVRCHPQLHNEFEATLEYMRLCFRKQNGGREMKEARRGGNSGELTAVFLSYIHVFSFASSKISQGGRVGAGLGLFSTETAPSECTVHPR